MPAGPPSWEGLSYGSRGSGCRQGRRARQVSCGLVPPADVGPARARTTPTTRPLGSSVWIVMTLSYTARPELELTPLMVAACRRRSGERAPPCHFRKFRASGTRDATPDRCGGTHVAHAAFGWFCSQHPQQAARSHPVQGISPLMRAEAPGHLTRCTETGGRAPCLVAFGGPARPRSSGCRAQVEGNGVSMRKSSSWRAESSCLKRPSLEGHPGVRGGRHNTAVRLPHMVLPRDSERHRKSQLCATVSPL